MVAYTLDPNGRTRGAGDVVVEFSVPLESVDREQNNCIWIALLVGRSESLVYGATHEEGTE